MEHGKESIVMFPLMAQGHIVPFLALALKLEQEKGFAITFVNTPLNIKKLKAYLPLESSIRLLEIPFNSSDHGLPSNCETTETLPLPLVRRLIEASSSLQPAFERLISDLVSEIKPLCVISDMFFGWSAEVAHKFGLFHAIFNAGGGYGMALFHTIWLNLPHLKVESEEFQLPNFPDGCKFPVKLLPSYLQEITGPWEFGQKMFQDWLKTDAMLFNTVEEIDHTGLTYFRQQFPCPVWAIGPIISSAGSRARAGEEEAAATQETCMKWLDSKPPSSVLYVAFGSQCSPSAPQIKQLALSLEASDVNFLWVVRPPSSFVSEDYENDWLPTGFEERIQHSKKGLVLKKWAPQIDILSHKSIGAFLSHCGWNSVMEALSNGVPMLSWPMGGEQPFNAKMLEEDLAVCIGVANGTTCEVYHQEIRVKIESVMKGIKGAQLKHKANKVREIIKLSSNNTNVFEGSSTRALDEFINAAILHITNNLNRSLTK